MDNQEKNQILLEILREGYYQDKNGRWVHKGPRGPPKILIQEKLFNRFNTY